MVDYLAGLGVVLGFLFGWNNGSLLFGNLRGSGAASWKSALTISAAGLAIGVLFEGPKMYSGLNGSLTASTTGEVLLVTLATTVVFTLLLTILSLPVSFSMVMVAAFTGSSLSSEIAVDSARSAAVVLFWFVAPMATALLAYMIYRLTTGFVVRLSLLGVDALNRSGSVVSALLASYTLGANNIGLIYGSTSVNVVTSQDALVLPSIVAAALLGMVVSKWSSVSGTVGDKMLSLSPQGVFTAFAASSVVVWAGTQLSIPVSITQCLLGGMFGAAITKKITVMNRRLVGETVSVWVVAPVLAFVIGYLLIRL